MKTRQTENTTKQPCAFPLSTPAASTTAPLLPPSSVTLLLARGPSQLEIRFDGVWIRFPFPNHFIFLYLKFSNYEIVPGWLSMSSPVWLYDLSFPTPPIGLLLSSPKAHGSGSGALHSVLFESCTMDVENNHSLPLVPRPPKSTPRIAMLAAAVPSAEWLPSKKTEKSSCAD